LFHNALANIFCSGTITHKIIPSRLIIQKTETTASTFSHHHGTLNHGLSIKALKVSEYIAEEGCIDDIAVCGKETITLHWKKGVL
jgi:hypothetical protein